MSTTSNGWESLPFGYDLIYDPYYWSHSQPDWYILHRVANEGRWFTYNVFYKWMSWPIIGEVRQSAAMPNGEGCLIKRKRQYTRVFIIWISRVTIYPWTRRHQMSDIGLSTKGLCIKSTFRQSLHWIYINVFHWCAMLFLSHVWYLVAYINQWSLMSVIHYVE